MERHSWRIGEMTMALAENKGTTTGRPSADELVAALFTNMAGGGSPELVYAIVDGARDPRIFPAVHDSGLEFECLLTDVLHGDLMKAAPYIVRLTKNAPFVKMLLHEGWGNSWGIFAQTYVNLEVLRRHCRSLLQVRTEEGPKLYFRYYDPRVLRAYLPTCTTAELRQFFGPVERWLVEGENAQLIVAGTDSIGSSHQMARNGLIMLSIRNAQIDSMAPLGLPMLVDKLLGILRRLGRVTDDNVASARELLLAAAARAVHKHKLLMEASIADFAGLALDLGIDFDEDPAVAARFSANDRSPEAQLQGIFEELNDDDWTRLRARREYHGTSLGA